MAVSVLWLFHIVPSFGLQCVIVYFLIIAGRQTGKQAGRQAGRQTGSQGRQAGRQACKQAFIIIEIRLTDNVLDFALTWGVLTLGRLTTS